MHVYRIYYVGQILNQNGELPVYVAVTMICIHELDICRLSKDARLCLMVTKMRSMKCA